VPLPVVVPEQETVRRIRDAIEAAIPGARVEAAGSGGHYEVRVVSASFEGKGTLARQRMVYSAIAHLMKGEGAPVHAIDRLETSAR
jgi:acid stress-induced BolA-like protein IbaG/YrbA